jgi:hypothetical protein
MGITMNQRGTTVTLYQGDDLDRLNDLRKTADRLQPTGTSTLTGDGDYVAAEQAYTDFHAEATGRAVEIELKPLGRKVWQQLVLDHPPRDDSDSDRAAGVNESTFSEPLVMASIEMSDAEKQEFLDSLTFGQFDTLYQDAFTINRVVYAPKAPQPGSAPSPSSGETSVSVEPSV